MNARISILLFALAGSAQAQVFTWASPVGGAWAEPTNWSPATVPNATTHIAQVDLAGPYVVSVDSLITVQGLSITNPFATLNLNPGAHFHTRQNGISTPGTIRVTGTSASLSDLTLDLPGSLTGGGTIVLDASSITGAAVIVGPQGNGYTISSGFTIRGVGELLGNRINNGLILADSPGGLSLSLQGTTSNSAVIKAVAPGRLSMPSTVVNQTPTGEITADGGTVQMTAGAISSGAIRCINGGTWEFGGATTINLNTVALEGPINMRSGAAVQVSGNLLVVGVLNINSNAGSNATLTWLQNGVLRGPGTVVLNGPMTTSAGISAGGNLLTIYFDANVVGTGRFLGNFQVFGRIAPGPIGGGIGSITFNQQFNLLPEAVLDLEVAGSGAGQVDTILGTGTAGLNGTLRIRPREGFIPTPGLGWEILHGSAVTGSFAALDLPPPVNGVTYTVERVGPQVFLRTSCYANCDNSSSAPLLTANDFQCFLNNFAAGANSANCDGSTAAPTLNANDFQCFLNLFAAGCP